jgi:hypothetical protein
MQIPYNEFKVFPQLLGPDALVNKGILAVKLDLSTVRKGSYLYVFNAHLQSSPASDQE